MGRIYLNHKSIEYKDTSSNLTILLKIIKVLHLWEKKK